MRHLREAAGEGHETQYAEVVEGAELSAQHVGLQRSCPMADGDQPCRYGATEVGHSAS